MSEDYKIVPLEYPFTYAPDEPQVTEIKIQRPKIQHVRGHVNLTKLEHDSDEMLKLVEKLLPVQGKKFMDKIDLVDLLKINEVVQSFLQSSQQT